MSNVAVIGSQWGDEGKGKIVDWLSERADVVIRFQGGHNAGHTLVIDGEVFKLSLLPSGVVRPGKLSILGNGVVIDPWALLREIDAIETQGVTVTPESFLVAENAVLILPLHQAVDRAREVAREKARGQQKIGTTGRGIGPAYEDKIGRRALRVCDLAHPELVARKVAALAAHHEAFLQAAGVAPVETDRIVEDLAELTPRLLSFAQPVWRRLEQERRAGKKILFEGAQGTMLDIDHGTYPFVTSSNTVVGQAATGAGLGPRSVNYVLGITKAYTTRVGSGPFPTELNDDIGQRLGERGREFGVVTGRKRRCGWFDAVMVRQAIQCGGIDGIALTKLDVLDGIDTLQICTGYRIDGKIYSYLPASPLLQQRAEPLYEAIDGWQESTAGARSWKQLPALAIKYIRRIEELIAAPVALLSTSPEREDTILVHDPFSA